MSIDPKAEQHTGKSAKDNNNPSPTPKKAKKKDSDKQYHVFSDVIEKANKIDLEKPKAFEEFLLLFEAVRRLKDLTNKQVEEFFALVGEKIEALWVPFLTKVAVVLCQGKNENDSKLIYEIRTICKNRFETYGILESSLTNAEKNLCLLCDEGYVTLFLQEAQKQNKQHEKQIPNSELACLSFVCFSLYCKASYDGNAKIQLLIDRAIAEYFSAYELSGIREKDLTGKILGNALSSKVFSYKKISELTYLYSGTTEKLSELSEDIKRLEEIRRNQTERITSLLAEIKAVTTQNQALQNENAVLRADAQHHREECEAAENRLDYEKNKFEKQLKTQEAGLAEQITSDIALELQAIRDLVDYLDEDDQKRFRRRLDRIDCYLKEFGGE